MPEPMRTLLEDCLTALGPDPWPGEWGLVDERREKPKLRARIRLALRGYDERLILACRAGWDAAMNGERGDCSYPKKEDYSPDWAKIVEECRA